ncbi:hypothetical protein RZS08_10270, partial [Arthrospira platensis SPKY1]|nr:hypothetical protein [Arthrospira platensis SPKY1]
MMGNEASVEATVTRHLERVNEVGVDNTIDGLVKDIITNHSSTLVLIIDEVQVSLSSKDGDSGMWALKSAMEHINYDDSVPGRFLCVNTGSHRGMVNLMATRRTDGLYDTPVENYKKLDRGYLQWFKSERQGKRNDQVWPSDDALEKGFAILGRRPLNLNTVMKSLEGYDGNDADRTFLALCHQNNLVTNTDEAERLLALGEL